MRERLLLLTVSLLVLAGCSGVPKSSAFQAEVESRDKTIAELHGLLAQKEQEISQLQRDLNDAKGKLTQSPPPNEPRVAAGSGHGRFVVVPSKVRPGDTIAIYNDVGNGTVRIHRLADEKEIAHLQGPKAHNFILYTLAEDLTPGKYRVSISGNGGWYGEAEVLVAQEQQS